MRTEPFIPVDSRPPVAQELARDAWSVAWRLIEIDGEGHERAQVHPRLAEEASRSRNKGGDLPVRPVPDADHLKENCDHA
jgi:hypothetical protein